MESDAFRLMLYLPAGGASETEATIIEWLVAEGEEFREGQALAQIDSAKSVFEFESPCAGKVIRILHRGGETVPLTEPIAEIETSDARMKDWIPPAAAGGIAEIRPQTMASSSASSHGKDEGVSILAVGGYLPKRIVTNADLVREFPGIDADYVFQVTGIRERRWAADDEKPSSMALQAAMAAIGKSGIAVQDIDAIVLATTTPDAAMPSTACILAARLGLPNVPAFDLNAACSGWLYAVGMARGMIVSGMARNVLAVGVDMQSRLLEPNDRSASFLFGDGAGAGVISAAKGHRIGHVTLGANTQGLGLAKREQPGYLVLDGRSNFDPWIRLDGPTLFRYAVDSFSRLIRDAIAAAGWPADEVPWIIPHQANGRILKAASKRSGIPFERFFLNVERVGNISSASIPVLLTEAEPHLKPNDKLVLCSVGAGLTTAAVTVEW